MSTGSDPNDSDVDSGIDRETDDDDDDDGDDDDDDDDDVAALACYSVAPPSFSVHAGGCGIK